MALFHENTDHVIQVVPLLEFDWLVHGFGTRHSKAWNKRADLITLKQTHSATCIPVRERPQEVLYGDALLTAAPGFLIGVRTADCVPILLVDPRRRAVAAVHSGWRGTAKRIAIKAVEQLVNQFGSNPEQLLAAIGPAIGPCCYQVGPEVAVQFRDWFPERNDLNGPAFLDLTEANRRQLVAAGLNPNHVFKAELCTRCLANKFFSYRREGEGVGRQIAAVGIIGKGPA